MSLRESKMRDWFTVAVLLLVAVPAVAQRPDSVRPPTVTRQPRDTALARSADLMIQALMSAYQDGDTAALSQLFSLDRPVPDDVVGATSRCDGMTLQTMARINPAPIALPGRVRIRNPVWLQGRVLSFNVQGDTVLRAQVQLSGPGPASFSIIFSREGDALHMVRTRGMHGALCKVLSTTLP